MDQSLFSLIFLGISSAMCTQYNRIFVLYYMHFQLDVPQILDSASDTKDVFVVI